MSYLGNAAQFLVDVLFGLVALLFGLRLLVQWVGVNFHNPICQSLYRLTNPILMPLRRWIKPWRRFDLAALLVVFLILALKATLLLALSGLSSGVPAILVLALAELASLSLMLYFWLILIRVLLSWIGGGQSPVVPIIMQITEPVLRPLRRMLPALGGFDLSPLLATLAILLLRILLVAPLQDAAIALAT